MADPKQSIAGTLVNEGPYSNRSADKGKETWRGIARVFWPSWKGWDIIDRAKLDHGISDTLDAGNFAWEVLDKILLAIPELDGMVEAFYIEHFWNPLDLNDEPSQAVADKVFDIAVNMGVSTARQFYEEAKKA